MAHESQAFLVRSQQRVIDGYRQLLATYPGMPSNEPVAIEARLAQAEEQLRKFNSFDAALPQRAVA